MKRNIVLAAAACLVAGLVFVACDSGGGGSKFSTFTGTANGGQSNTAAQAVTVSLTGNANVIDKIEIDLSTQTNSTSGNNANVFNTARWELWKSQAEVYFMEGDRFNFTGFVPDTSSITTLTVDGITRATNTFRAIINATNDALDQMGRDPILEPFTWNSNVAAAGTTQTGSGSGHAGHGATGPITVSITATTGNVISTADFDIDNGWGAGTNNNATILARIPALMTNVDALFADSAALQDLHPWIFADFDDFKALVNPALTDGLSGPTVGETTKGIFDATRDALTKF